MQYYNTKLRLGGSTMNEVRKVMSAPEVLILQYIHGVDAITDISKAYVTTTNLSEEKSRLRGQYDQALVKRDQSVNKIFGPLGAVPTKLPDELSEQYDIIDEDDIIAVAKNITKKDKVESRTPLSTNSQIEEDRMNKMVSQDEVVLADIME